jgi:leucyl-tRNA synthetase
MEWDDRSVVGIQRWLARVTRLIQHISQHAAPTHQLDGDTTLDVTNMSKDDRDLYRETNKTVREVTAAFDENFIFNAAIASLIKLTHAATAAAFGTTKSPINAAVQHYAADRLLRMLAPFAPATSEELWETLYGTLPDASKSVFQARWPTVDQQGLAVDTVTCAVQVNGKLRWCFELPSTALGDTALVEQLARACPESKRYLPDSTETNGPQVRRVIVVRGGTLVNFIVK